MQLLSMENEESSTSETLSIAYFFTLKKSQMA